MNFNYKYGQKKKKGLFCGCLIFLIEGFNNFFEFPIEVSSNVDAAILAHFETITDNKESARALASAVIYTALKQGLNPMAVLDEFRNISPGDLNTYTALFLNYERRGTSFLGLVNRPVQNKYVTRAILP